MPDSRRAPAPRVLTIPSSDQAFRKQVERIVHDERPERAADFEERLRRLFPRAVVRFREISGEPATWYVYRDGGWRSDLLGPWWQAADLPRVVVSGDGWLLEATPTALDLLGVDAADVTSRHFTDFVAPGSLDDSVAMFAILAAGNELTATVLLRPTTGDVIAVDIHSHREADTIVSVFRLADEVELPAPSDAPAPATVVTTPATDAAFRGYVEMALARMPEPTLDGLALRLRRLYPHAQVDDEGGGRWHARREGAGLAEPESGWWTDSSLARVRYDARALITEANEAAEELLGRSLVGRHWQELVTPGSTEQVSAMLSILAEVGRAESRFRMPRGDGTLLEFDSYTEVDGDGFTTVMRPRA